jgi:predicted enzyme involved in methoxymalonyl-ACP biosynthesis
MSLEMTSRWQLPKKISETGYRERHLKNNPSKKYQIKIDWQVKYKKKKKNGSHFTTGRDSHLFLLDADQEEINRKCVCNGLCNVIGFQKGKSQPTLLVYLTENHDPLAATEADKSF